MKLQQEETHKKLLYGLVIYDIDQESDIEKAIESVLEIDYPEDKIKIIVSSYMHRDNPRYVNFANIILKKFRHCKLLLNNPTVSREEIDFNSFSLCKHANYLVKMNHNQKIPSDFFNKVNEVAGENVVVCYNNITALPYKSVSRTYLKFKDFDNMTNELIREAKDNNVLEIIK